MRGKILNLLLLSVVLAACSQSNLSTESRTKVATEIIIARATVKPISPTNTPAIISAEPSIVASATTTQRPTVTPTFTPPPTLSPVEARQMVEKLLSANSFCRLPCFGGLIPGKTKVSDALESFSRFADQVTCPTRLRCEIRFPAIDQEVGSGEIIIRIFRSQDALDDLEAVLGFWNNYSVQEFLAEYGQPSDIYFYVTDALSTDAENYFTIILHYAPQGISAIFNGITGKGAKLEICPSKLSNQIDNPFLIVWKPTSEDNFSKVYTRYQVMSSNALKDLRPIEDYGDITVNEFFSTYRELANQQHCFEIDNPWLR